jgi:hypothetical protein
MPAAVEAVNRQRGVVLLDDGQIVPVAAWFVSRDGAAIPCEASEATIALAGPDQDGKWRSVALELFDRRPH